MRKILGRVSGHQLSPGSVVLNEDPAAKVKVASSGNDLEMGWDGMGWGEMRWNGVGS